MSSNFLIIFYSASPPRNDLIIFSWSPSSYCKRNQIYFSIFLIFFCAFYPENTNIGEKRINKKRKRHTPLNPPSMGEWIQQFLSLEGCRLRRGGRFSFVIQSFHPHPHLLPSREKELWVVIARPGFLRSWQSHDSFFIILPLDKGGSIGIRLVYKNSNPPYLLC